MTDFTRSGVTVHVVPPTVVPGTWLKVLLVDLQDGLALILEELRGRRGL